MQPVFLCVHLKPGKGKDLNESNSSESRNSLPRLQRRKTLSINGEEVLNDMDFVNIHDYAVFEKDEALLPEFKTSIRRKSSSSGGASGKEGSKEGGLKVAEVNGEGKVRRKSFHQIAKEITTVERVLLHWPGARTRMRHHSSSSEDFNQEEEEEEEGGVQNLNNNRVVVPGSKPEVDVLSNTTELSEVSISLSDYTPDSSPARVPQVKVSSPSTSDCSLESPPTEVPQSTHSKQQAHAEKTRPHTSQTLQEVDLHDVDPSAKHASSSCGTSVTPTQSVRTQQSAAPLGEGPPSPPVESKTSKLEGASSCPCDLL